MSSPPSSEHEDVLELVRNAPSLAVELVRAAGLGHALPPGTAPQLVSEALTQVRPAELRADALILLREGTKNRLALVVEVQRHRDSRKRWSWPSYEVAAHERYRCATLLLVLAPDPGVARWARRPIPLGNGGSVRPLVLSGPQVPAITDEETARRLPELAVLSAMMHGAGEPELAARIALVAELAVQDLPGTRGRLYTDFIEKALSQAAILLLEERLMSLPNYQWKSAFALKHRGEGREEGLEEGLEKGLEKGRLQGQRETLRQLSAVKFGPLPEWAARRLETADAAALARWTQRLFIADSLESLLSEG